MKGRLLILTSLIAAAASAGGVTWYETGDGASTTAATTGAARASLASATTKTLTANQVYRASAKGVVEIKTTTSGPGFGPPGVGDQAGSAQGTGFEGDKQGDIVTNYHVVSGATSIQVTLADGKTYTARVVAKDESNDLAVIRVNVPASKLYPLRLADSSTVQVGQAVLAIGDPYGLADTATTGIVSGLNRTITAPNGSKITDAIQTDAALNSGNSGGPLLDSLGRVIGVNSQIESQSGGNVGIGFAVPSNTVQALLSQLSA